MGVAKDVPGYAAGTAAPKSAKGGSGYSNSLTNSFGNITINTQATDARGIAADFGVEMRRMVESRNSGVLQGGGI